MEIELRIYETEIDFSIDENNYTRVYDALYIKDLAEGDTIYIEGYDGDPNPVFWIRIVDIWSIMPNHKNLITKKIYHATKEELI